MTISSIQELDLDADLSRIVSNLGQDNHLGFDLLISPGSSFCQLRILCYQVGIRLSKIMPIIENFGFQVIDEKVLHLADAPVVLYEFSLEIKAMINLDQQESIKFNLEYGLYQVFHGYVENDLLNQLVLLSGFTIQQVTLFRAVVQYLVQTNLAFSKQYISQCFCKHNIIISKLFEYFVLKFNLDSKKTDIRLLQNELDQQIEYLINGIDSIDEDAILRTVYSLLKAMVRTNYYQLDHAGNNKNYISFKISSRQVLNLPQPYPLYEIFVYSKDFEGIHLRGAKVARGGIRWSDRHEDFRTEVLGLLKAQIVKNSVIVPSGAKGGFICKNVVNTTKEQLQQIGIENYKHYIRSLLEITDNLVKGKIVKPDNVVCYDEDDPYLVVAADKGTSTFSDYANNLSNDYNFWLGDAFASGGSAGYDHKKLGITAKGAWESAKCHFKYLNKNIQTEEFTVIGIGDMAGDVFGNGMLLSKFIKLTAAFNHMHIFLDPNPDIITSYEERLRLFKMTGSSWGDYDPSKISSGGGVFLRSSKSITLSAEARFMLAVDEVEVTPNQLISLILKMQADMLYNGGIGTYVKSSKQSNENVRDKTNDLVRIDADQLRVKVVVEGGNLGVTQLARIEFATKGGNIFTDAIDNSAGVDCSDHEVNIKILFNNIMQDISLNLYDRNIILEQMSQAVVDLVLRDNYLQTHILKLEQFRSYERAPQYLVIMNKLEEEGRLNRSLEFLPLDVVITERRKHNTGLLLPELAVLLSYTKMSLEQELLNSEIVEDYSFDNLLVGYFPHYLQENYKKHILQHYLRKEIIATQLANLVVNREGIPFISRIQDEFDVGVSQIVKMWWISYSLLGADRLYKQIEGLEYKVSPQILLEIMLILSRVVEWQTQWLVNYFKDDKNLEYLSKLLENSYSVARVIERFAEPVQLLLNKIDQIIPAKEYKKEFEEEQKYIEQGIPTNLAKIIARREFLPHIMDIVLISAETNVNVLVVATNYYKFGRELDLDWFRDFAAALPRDNKWQILARSVILLDIYSLYRSLLFNAIKRYGIQADYVILWQTEYRYQHEQLQSMVEEMRSSDRIDISMVIYALRKYSNFLL